MNYRKLGRTGLEVSEIGYGAWGIAGDAWLGAKDEQSLEALNRAVDLGLNFIDTALAYGGGHSERLVGKVVAERDEAIHVATKVPPKNREWPAPAGLHPDEAFPGDYVRECTEESLRNLGVEALDVQQFHVWQDEWLGEGGWQEAVEDLKREGKIRHFGVSINDHQPANAVRLIETGLVDTVQVIYNVFDQSPEDGLLPACQEHGVGVIVRVPFDEGALTGNVTPETTFDEGDFRNHYFRGDRKHEVQERVRAIISELGASEDEIAEIALRYILSHPAVSTVIPGMRSVRNVERNMRVGDGKGLPEDQVRLLKNHRWVRNFYA
ncbi:MAG: Putative oxidoreductase [uncultured Rubrobacteraceae bacterium]|uniref:Oxidoreductase n=1 Tax=uncultured Rubrobacteraceae bacterium TaxID=349277 RepID=A0A6J4QY88_9ACTN|nr:MAG: Putative oxidoreductase [uncultured Rubrobacteraceae bacterium]